MSTKNNNNNSEWIKCQSLFLAANKTYFLFLGIMTSNYVYRNTKTVFMALRPDSESWPPLTGLRDDLSHTTLGRTPLGKWSVRRKDNKQHLLEKDIHAVGGIRTRNPSKRTARAATGIGKTKIYGTVIRITLFCTRKTRAVCKKMVVSLEPLNGKYRIFSNLIRTSFCRFLKRKKKLVRGSNPYLSFNRPSPTRQTDSVMSDDGESDE